MIHRECQANRLPFVSLFIVLGLSLLFSACSSTSSFVAQGEEYLKKRKFHDALMQFRSAVDSDSESAAAHWGMARAHEQLGQFSETLEELRKTVELDDANLEAKAKLGNYFLLVQPPMIYEAEKLRDEILSKDNGFIDGHILTASIMAAQGKPDADVVKAVDKAIALDPKRIESYISLQRLYMTRENALEAETAIKRGLDANPESVLGHTEYGRFLMYAERDAEAETAFQKAIALDGASIEAREAAAEFFKVSGQMDKAEQTYLDLVRIQEDSPESRLVLAEFYATTGRGDSAIEVLDQILTDSPEYVLARYRLGQMHLTRGDTAKVNEQLEALFAVNDDDTEALMLRARLRMKENSPEDAVKDVEEVLKKYPSGKEPLFLMSQARLAAGQIDQANAFIADLNRYHPSYLKTGLLKIQAAFTTGDAQNALKLASELINRANAATPTAETGPQALQDLRMRGMSSRGLANLDLGKLAEAKGDLEQVVKMSPRSSSALVNLAKVSIAERDYESALGLYERALNADSQNFDAVSGIVSMSIRLNQTAKAHGRIDSLISANAGRGDVIAALHYLKSTVFAAEKNIAAAEKELTTAIGIDENYFPAYSHYASLLVSQNRTDEAIAQYNKVVEKRPAAQVYTMIGILEDSRGNGSAAETAYRKALEINPEMPIAANNLAWLLADSQGNLDEALQLASSAVAKNEGVAGFHDTLGWVYLKKGLASSAVTQLKRAVALEESNSQRTGIAPNPDYRLRLGMALAKAGGKDA